jgi:hypothetical protein
MEGGFRQRFKGRKVFLNFSPTASRGGRVRVRRHSPVRPPHHRIESTCGRRYGRRARARTPGDSGRRCIRHNDTRRLQRREARRTVFADTIVGRERNSAATTFFFAARGNKRSELLRKQTRRVWFRLDRHVQLSRSRAVLTHSHARAPPPYPSRSPF